MISSNPYNFLTGAELLAKPREIASHPQSSTSGVVAESPPEANNISQQGGFSSQSSVTSLTTENWGPAGDQVGFESRVGPSDQETSPTNISRLSTSVSVGSSFVVGSGSPSRLGTSSSRNRMATYLSGSNVQADGMQTLYLMNPSYTYSDNSNAGNMVLIGPTPVGQGSPLGNPSQQHQQQHYLGFSLPPALNQSPLSQQSHIAAISNSHTGHQSASSNIFTGRVSNQGYNWSGGNEFSFLPSSDMTEDNHSLAARLNSVNSGQQTTSDMSQYAVRNLSQPSLQEQAGLIPNGVALGLNMESLQASTGAGQILSLSLSPQQPSVIPLQSFPMQHSESGLSSCQRFSNSGVDNSPSKGDRFINRGSLSSFKDSSRESMLGPGFQTQPNRAASNRQVSMMSSAPTMEIFGSKYLKAAQQLLNEVVSVGRNIKSSSSKHTKMQSWMGPSSVSDGSLVKDRNMGEHNGKDGAPTVSWTTGKDGGPTLTAVHTSTAGIPEHSPENAVELTPAERQELQMKKAKLMAMLDEVDRRYKQYYHQMQIVVQSFESVAGLGAARTYTALALQTISKHFRCLKDAISGQIRATSRALGEEDISGQRGGTSRLRLIDQQLRQQRALQQLGMMQQHAWRPQRGLPERSVSILRAWLFEHFLHPYPKDSDKVLLARQTGLSRSQVSNWFINARVRLWKPMVEEMYTEEMREGDMEGVDKAARDEEETISKGAGMVDGSGNSDKVAKQAKAIDANSEGFSEPKNASEHACDVLQSRNLPSASSETFLFHEKESRRQGVKKARNGVQDPTSLLSPNHSALVDFKADGGSVEESLEHDIKIRTEDRHMENYGIPQSGFVQADHQNLGSYGSYQVSGLNRYPQEGLATRYAANSGVSLTLGLQHSEGLSLSGAQQPYIQGQGQISTERSQEGGGAAATYYTMNDNSTGQTNSYEALSLQNRKRFASHFLHHDFAG